MWLATMGETAIMPALPIKAVDTLGAGDVFHGAFALALAEGSDFAQAHALRRGGSRDQMHPLRRDCGRPDPRGVGGFFGWRGQQILLQ